MAYIRNDKALKAIGIHVRKLREKAGLSQQDFAYKCDMDLSQINRVELGKVNATISIFIKIADTLGISVSELLNVNF